MGRLRCTYGLHVRLKRIREGQRRGSGKISKKSANGHVAAANGPVLGLETQDKLRTDSKGPVVRCRGLTVISRQNARFRTVCVGLAAALAATLHGAPLFAEGSTSYLIDRWNTEAGLPQNSVNAIMQSRDGRLWLATLGGIASFDGTAFVPIPTGDRIGLRSRCRGGRAVQWTRDYSRHSRVPRARLAGCARQQGRLLGCSGRPPGRRRRLPDCRRVAAAGDPVRSGVAQRDASPRGPRGSRASFQPPSPWVCSPPRLNC